MNGDEALARIRDAMREKANETQSVQKLIDKINSGKAGFQDTELYARWAAVNLGLCLSDAVCKIDLQDRPAVCRALLLDQYEDLNGFLGLVQQELDSRFGIRIAPQRAPFPETRVQKLGNSLTDRTVPDATIERRARSGAENVTNALHDDYMKANAEFRDRAGMTSYIIRDGSAKCCDWCADVSGKYTLDSAPAGIWGRHDNCKCSILYESKRSGRQLLRGTSKKWEVVAEGAGAGELHRLSGDEAATAGAPEPVVFTKEQAEALQEEHQLKRLTNRSEKRIIKLSINLFDPSDPIYLDALSIEEEPGFEDVHLHGSPNSVEKIINGKKKLFSADEFAKLLKQSGYTSGDIRLCSCSTGQGDNSFAQKLSKILGCKVKAPDDDVYYIPEDGVMFIGSQFGNTGKWRIFDKGVEVT